MLSFSITHPQRKKNLFPPFPPQGIQFLLENDLLQQTPEDIAQFLYKGEGLNKTVIGDYLGERWDRGVQKQIPSYTRLTRPKLLEKGIKGRTCQWERREGEVIDLPYLSHHKF